MNVVLHAVWCNLRYARCFRGPSSAWHYQVSIARTVPEHSFSYVINLSFVCGPEAYFKQ